MEEKSLVKIWEGFGEGNKVVVQLKMKRGRIENGNERIGVRVFEVAATPFLGFLENGEER